MKLLDNGTVFSIKNFTGNFQGNYMYISNPAIFADIGEFDLNLQNLSLLLNTSSSFDGEQSTMNLTLNEIGLNIDPFTLEFEGISDITNVASRLITYGGNVIRGRLNSIVKYAGKQRLQPLINSLIGLIPDEIDIPGTEYQIEGGISDNFEVVANEYFLIPLDVSIHNHDKPYI